MTEHLIISSAAIVAMAILALTGLKAWQDWIALKEHELERTPPSYRAETFGSPVGAARIEIADLKERIRRLEAIASGVDL